MRPRYEANDNLDLQWNGLDVLTVVQVVRLAFTDRVRVVPQRALRSFRLRRSRGGIGVRSSHRCASDCPAMPRPGSGPRLTCTTGLSGLSALQHLQQPERRPGRPLRPAFPLRHGGFIHPGQPREHRLAQTGRGPDPFHFRTAIACRGGRTAGPYPACPQRSSRRRDAMRRRGCVPSPAPPPSCPVSSATVGGNRGQHLGQSY